MSKSSGSGGAGASVVERLARWSLSIADDDAPAAALRQAKLLVLDTVGGGLAALSDETGRSALDIARSLGGAPQCVAIGMTHRTSLLEACFVNGVLIRALDLNDYVVEPGGGIGGHPSDNIPVALACAEFAGRSGRSALAAIVVGYEIFDRFKRAMGGSRSAWDGVSVSGVVSAAIASRLLRLDVEQTSHALALALSYSAVSANVRAGDISGAKSIANALVARHGVHAALLARANVTGPLGILDHPRGMRAVFHDIDKIGPIDAPLGDDSYIMHSSMKAYPCVATGQAAVEAALELNRLGAGDLADCREIVVEMLDHPTIVAQQVDPVRIDPQSHEAADHSFQFIVAVALQDGAFGLDQYQGERWNDPKIREIMRKIRLTTSADLTARARKRTFPCAIEMRFGTAPARRVEILDPPGSGAAGLSESEILKKFEDLAKTRLNLADRRRLIDSVLSLDMAKTCADAIEVARYATVS